MLKSHLLLLLIVVICDFESVFALSKLWKGPHQCGSVYLTVSSLQQIVPGNRAKIGDKLELNWDFTMCTHRDISDIPNQVALFDEDPTLESSSSPPLEIVDISNYTWKYHVTNVSLVVDKLPGEWGNEPDENIETKPIITTGPQCLPFWIAGFRDGNLLTSNCLKIQPTWIGDIREYIGNMALSRLVLPGAHNSGSHAFSNPAMQGLLERWVLCQDRSVWTQLVSGVRYLDFRIAYYETIVTIFLQEDNFWLNHNMVKVTPLTPLLRDVRRFLDSTTDEIVILDIHQLPVGFPQANGSVPERQQRLLNLLKRELDEHILDFAVVVQDSPKHVIIGPTVNEILKTGRRLIIGYPDKYVTSQNSWLWPNVKHMWANTNNPYKLKNYLDSAMKYSYRPTTPGSNPLWSAMAQTTPSTMDVILDIDGSLRKNADAVNRNLTYWVQNEWWHKANIISSDFYLGNNLIDLAVFFNKFRGKLIQSSVAGTFFLR